MVTCDFCDRPAECCVLIRQNRRLEHHVVCANHLNEKCGLRIGVSTIPHAGHGLFATKQFRSGSLVGYYVGPTRTIPSRGKDKPMIGQRRIDEFQKKNGGELEPHDIVVKFDDTDEWRLIDGRNPYQCTVMRMMNDPIGPNRSTEIVRQRTSEHPPNVEMSPDPIVKDFSDEYMGYEIRAIRDIEAGHELFFDYGPRYWQKHPDYVKVADIKESQKRKRSELNRERNQIFLATHDEHGVSHYHREIEENRRRRQEHQFRFWVYPHQASPVREDEEPGMIQHFIDFFSWGLPRRRDA